MGLAAAIDYLTAIGWDKLHAQEVALTDFALQGLRAMPYVHVIGAEKAEEHCGILTFTVDGVHPHDISAILDAADVAIRAGHHCAQPLMQHLGTPSTARANAFRQWIRQMTFPYSPGYPPMESMYNCFPQGGM